MKRILWALFFLLTVAGLILPFRLPGSWPWWDSTWIFLFFVATYADLAGSAGLNTARVSSGIVVIAMALLLGLTGLTGWPCGPLRFTAFAGLQIGGAIPLAIPLLACALLTVSAQAAVTAWPGAGRVGLAVATAAGFLLSVLNGLVFFSRDRVWWIWNPLEEPNPLGRAGFGLLFLAVAVFALAFAYPAETRMRTSRWTTGSVAWVFMNALFLVANFAMFLK